MFQTYPPPNQKHDMTFIATHYLLWCLNWWLISSTSFSIFLCLDRGCLFMVEASFFDRLLPLNIHQKPRNASIFLGKIWRKFWRYFRNLNPMRWNSQSRRRFDPGRNRSRDLYSNESFQNLGSPGTCMWLIIRVIVSPLTGILPLPNGVNWLINGGY